MSWWCTIVSHRASLLQAPAVCPGDGEAEDSLSFPFSSLVGVRRWCIYVMLLMDVSWNFQGDVCGCCSNLLVNSYLSINPWSHTACGFSSLLHDLVFLFNNWKPWYPDLVVWLLFPVLGINSLFLFSNQHVCISDLNLCIVPKLLEESSWPSEMHCPNSLKRKIVAAIIYLRHSVKHYQYLCHFNTKLLVKIFCIIL
jgi:hypothetical protein